MINIAFVDCETTHLDAEIGEAWEVAVIQREQDGNRLTDTEYCWQFAVDRAAADSEALRIGRFRERYLVDPSWGAAWTGPGPVIPCSRADAVNAIVALLRGTMLVGSNPGFDERHLRKLLGPGSAQWHYRPYDIVQLAAAKLGVYAAGPLPWRAHVLSRAVGVEPPSEETAHTALGDARWARDVFDAVMTTQEQFPLSWEGRAKHAIGLYTQTVIELEDARRDLRRAQAPIERAAKLATQWAILRAYGGAATELRAVIAGREPNALPEGFSVDTCVTAKCAVCEYEFDEDESSTIHFEDLDTAHATLRGYDWTILPDGRAVCPVDDKEHRSLYETDDATSQPVSLDQTALDISDPDVEDEETGDADGEVRPS